MHYGDQPDGARALSVRIEATSPTERAPAARKPTPEELRCRGMRKHLADMENPRNKVFKGSMEDLKLTPMTAQERAEATAREREVIRLDCK